MRPLARIYNRSLHQLHSLFQTEYYNMSGRKSKTEKQSIPLSKEPGIRARCGFSCSRCPIYKENVKSDADRERVSVVFRKLYSYDLLPGDVYCDGCLEPDENNPRRPGTERCPIRDCVLEKKSAHCGDCNIFPCELMERHFASVESVLKKAREILTGEEYRDFIEPYLSREYLSGRGST